MKYYQGQEVLDKLCQSKYPFPKDETIVRVRHGGASFQSETLESLCLPYGLKLKVVEIVKFSNGVDYVSVFEKKTSA